MIQKNLGLVGGCDTHSAPAEKVDTQSPFTPVPSEPQRCIALNVRRLDRNTLKGTFDLQLASGLLLRGCMLHLSHRHWWIGLPSRPHTSAAGAQTWTPIIDFRDRAAKDRFQAIAMAAIAAHFPEITAAADPDRGE